MKAALSFLGAALSCANSLGALQWETVHPFPGIPAITAVLHGEGRFIATTTRGIYSSPGSGWERSEAPDVNYTGLAAGNGVYVAVSDAGAIQTSTNGLNWLATMAPGDHSFSTITFGGGRFVASGKNGLIATSNNGSDWQIVTSGTNLSLITYGHGQFLIAQQPAGFPTLSSEFLLSADGTNWSRFFANIPNVDPNCVPNPRFGMVCEQFRAFSGLAYGHGQFVLNAQYGLLPASRALVSTDGTNWTAQGSVTQGGNVTPVGPPNKLFFLNDRFVYLDLQARWSDSLQSWHTIALPFPPFEFPMITLSSVAFGNGTYLLAGGQDGWAFQAVGADLDQLQRPATTVRMGEFRAAASRGSTVVAANPLVVSTNGGKSFQNAQTDTSLNGVNLTGILAEQGKFVAVGSGGTVLRSTDGMSWQKRLSNTTRDISDIAFGSATWVAVGQNGLVITSPDASFFTLRNSGTEVALHAVAWGDGLFVAVGDSGAILKSSNGETWSVQGTDEARDLQGVAYGNGRFVAVGAGGVVHVSTNGIDWASSSIPGAGSLSRIAFAAGSFVTIQADSTIAYESTNGTQWTSFTLVRPLLGVNSSEDTIWAAGRSVYLARGTADRVAGILSGRINEQGKFAVSFTPPAPGNYQISSSPVLGGMWEAQTAFTNAQGRIDWVDPRPLARAQFYRVTPE